MRPSPCHAAWRSALLGAASSVCLLGVALADQVDYDAAQAVFGEPVTLSVTGSPLRASEVPATITILTQDDIRRLGADTLPDILRTVPGLDLHQSGILAADATIRGYASQDTPRLLLLIDGVPFYNDYTGSTDLVNIPVQLAEIRQIEVVRTPSSALFGFDAMCGVINIITFDPATHPVNEIRARTGTQALAEESAIATFKLAPNSGLRLSAGAFRANEFTPPAGMAAPAHPFVNQLDGTVHLALGDIAGLVLQAGYAADRDTADDQLFRTFDTRTNEQRGELTLATALGDMTAAAWRRQTTLNVLSFHSSGTTDKWDASFSWLAKPGAAHTIRLDIDYARTDLQSPEISAAPGFIGDTDFAASLMWRWQLRPHLSLTNAIRLDAFKTSPAVPAGDAAPPQANLPRDIDALSFNSGLVWQPDQADTLRLIAARGLQLPSLDGFISQVEITPGLLTAADASIAPVSVTSIEAGADRRLDLIDGYGHINLFAERNDSLITPLLLPPTRPFSPALFYFTNIGHSFAGGTEIGLDGTVGPALSWKAWYTYTAITDRLRRFPGLPPLPPYAGQTPRHVFYLRADYHSEAIDFGVGARWQSAYLDPSGLSLYAPGFHHIPGHLSVDARLAWHVRPRLTLELVALQALQHTLAEGGGTAVARRILIGAIYDFQ